MKNIGIHLITFIFAFLPFQLFGDNLNATVVHASDAQSNDGSIDLHVSGGFEPYTYQWSTGETTEDINELSTGEYCVTVTDALCGEANLCISIESDCQTFLFFGVRYHWACRGQNDGSLSIALSNSGTAPYTFEWSNGGTTQSIENLAPGWYEVTVTDATNCSQNGIFRVYEKQIVLDAEVEGACSSNSGTIDLSVTNQYTRWPFSYQWSNGETTEDLNGLAPGNYCVTVTDGERCSASDCFEVTSSFNVWVASVTNNEICGNHCNGAINVEIPAGVNASYQWTGPNGFSSTSQDVMGLCNGNYQLTVISDEGCRKTLSVRICCCFGGFGGPGDGESNLHLCYRNSDSQNTEAPPIAIEVNTITPIGYGNNLGAIDLSVTGGASTLYYSWTGPNGFTAFTQDIRKLNVGTYCVTVTDGCDPISECFTIVDCEVQEFSFSGEATVACNGFDVGAIRLNVSGGTAPYQYQWDNGATTKDIFALSDGRYCVTVTDKNYCRLDQCFDVGIGKITQRWVECTFVTECSGQTVLSNAYPIIYRTNPLDCRYVDALCTGTNTIIGTPIFVGTTQRLEGCDLVTRNNRTGEECSRIRGTPGTTTLSGYDQVRECFYCLRVSFCDFGDYAVITSVVNSLGFGGGGGCVDCGGILCGCWQVLTCNGVEFVRWCDPECDDQVKVCPLNFGLDNEYTGKGHYEEYTFDDAPELGTIEVFIPTIEYDDEFLQWLFATEGIATEITQIKSTAVSLDLEKDFDIAGTDVFSNDRKAIPKLLAIPNPFNSELEITLSIQQTSSENGVLQVLDITGRVINYKTVTIQDGPNRWPLDLSLYADGVYFVVLNTGTEVYQTKIIKSK